MTKDQKAVHLAEVMDVGNMGTAILRQVIDQMYEAIAPELESDARRTVIKSALEVFMVEGSARVGELTEAVGKVYLECYTEEEMDALISFYTNPVGRSVQAKTVTVFGLSSRMGSEWGQLILEDIKPRIEKMLDAPKGE